jgi:hypothetical protein
MGPDPTPPEQYAGYLNFVSPSRLRARLISRSQQDWLCDGQSGLRQMLGPRPDMAI